MPDVWRAFCAGTCRDDFEFVGVTDLMELGIECEPEEVWCDVVETVRPMERRRVLIPASEQLDAFQRDMARPTCNCKNLKERSSVKDATSHTEG